MNYQVLNKSLIIFALSLFFTFFSLTDNAESEVCSNDTDKMVSLSENNRVAYCSPDKNFTKQLNWTENDSTDYGYERGSGYTYKVDGFPCFNFLRAKTYDGKQIAFSFYYKGASSDQENLCENEIYQVTSEPANSVNYLVGVNENAVAYGRVRDAIFYSFKSGFVVVVNSDAKKLCIKQPSDKGVVNACYDLTEAQLKLSSIIKTRIKAIRLREEAKGNIVATTTPVDVDTSVTDTMGPKIDVPGKLVAKNDQIILTGKVTDESTIASVKIDNTSLSLNEDGAFEIALYVPLDGLSVSIEAIDKFTNKTSRTILISREQDTSSEQLVKMAPPQPYKNKRQREP